MEKVLIFIVLLSLLTFIDGAPKHALITKLPGFDGSFPSKHYSGYVNIDEKSGKNLFYYFVVSERKPSEDPIVLWLNGGPGCSSFDGFIYEHGPFNYQTAKTHGGLPKLQLNPYSWSKVSNILYLDAPSGVGMSYSDNKSDYKTGDRKTATDSHAFLLKWFELYPEFLLNPFYISGESYAGVYLPTLAYEIVKGLDAGTKPVLNFKGYMVGNGVTDEVFDGNALVPFAHGMALISDNLFEDVTTACNGSFWNSTNNKCSELLGKVYQDVADLNIYDILEPCFHSTKARETDTSHPTPPSSFKNLGATKRPLAVRKRIFGRAWPYRAPVKEGLVPTWPQILHGSVGCFDDEVAPLWLNNKAVKKAIHAKENLNWELCTDNIEYYHDLGSMIPYHKYLTARGYRALISSGDHDMCVPFTGSEAWTRSLGYKIIDEWRPWIFDDQVAGYTQGYDHNLTFLTVKGSGHTIPEYKPKEALAFFTRWLDGEKI
ncbi:hypothetical protein C5167_040267 [Papaver somniferum]|uniref:Carboxypeptidase n=1 Tax=Papaver somniferum TaxID=3469 RepID=A0A4Y7IGY6_PAPSO|nr:serine carboxypeptidase-like 20 [Papaver somniferum]RZC47326.1 hypothetical protein C5167_040267 [Papaver somniferum]